ncbi:MAG TPA: hypothetical protein VFC16_06145 [Nakamurella sp.]|nr:hypothetical protein [Nakamurella sp.]
MKRSDGAKAWSTVLSELAQVPVSVAWERPSWRVSWQDGPTREALMGRAAALGTYRVGAPLPFEDLRFARSSSALALAVAWLARGSPGSPATARAAVADVEAFCADTGYPQARFDAGALAAAELLRRVGHGDIAEMGALLARAVPPVAASVMLPAGPELTGRVVTYRWPAGGPPGELLGPSGRRVEPGADTVRPSACQRCGKPLHSDGSRGGRPARYCSGACRTAAHRARRRTTPDTAGR